VQVQVILDKSQRTEQYPSADFLANQGGATTIDAERAIAHRKLVVIHGEIVMTGSFIWLRRRRRKTRRTC
jgi:hypothetical protein